MEKNGRSTLRVERARRPYRRTLILLSAGFATLLAIAITTQVGLFLLSGMRAYVGGEGLWSKAQKDAVNWLHRYAESRDETAYRAYQAAIQVPIGDRMAREELEKPRFDPAIVRRGFLLGRNHPDDVQNMALLFRRFRRVGYLQKSIAIWERADVEISALVAAGQRLHSAVQAGAPREVLSPILGEIDAVNARVTPLEDEFSFTLGEAARWAKGLVLELVVGAALLLLFSSALVLRKLGREIAASEERYRSVTETVTDGILSIDAGGRVLFANSAAARIFGQPAGRLVGTVFEDLLAEDQKEEAGSVLRRCLGTDGTHDPEGAVRLRARHADGHEIPVEVSFAEGSGGGPVFTGIVRDITLRMQEEEQIERLAYHDALTGLPNRALFNDRLKQALSRARRRKEMLAVLFLDLDEFKRVNDSLGHARGDEVLREVGTRLKSDLRGQDTAARVGGDEFIVVLQELEGTQDAARVAEKVLAAIARPIGLGGESVSVTTSIGVSVFPNDGMDLETLVRNADIAMYRAKKKGCRTFEFYTPGMNRELVARDETERELYRALDRGELALRYQPIWRTRDERIVGLEAVLRWRHPRRGELRPGEFLPAVDGSAVMLPLGDWVLATACEQVRHWFDEGLEVPRVSVNLSARQIQQPSLPNRVERTISSFNLSPGHVDLEVAETAAMRDIDLTIRMLTELRRRGLRILMDDFGSGHASIRNLRRLPVDILKIDRHFVDSIDSSPTDATIVRSIIEMAHGLGLSVIAEGVVRPRQLEILRDHGCDEFQGHPRGPAPEPGGAADLVAAQAG